LFVYGRCQPCAGKLVLGSDNFFDLPAVAGLGYDSSDGHAFWSLFARPTIGSSYSMLPVPNTTVGYARCTAADACPTLVGP
jgi:hypothetical protein